MTEIERIIEILTKVSERVFHTKWSRATQHDYVQEYAKAIEQFMYEYTQKALDAQQKDHEQYVIKARLSEDEVYEALLKIYRQGTFPSLGRLRAFAKAVKAAELRKELK